MIGVVNVAGRLPTIRRRMIDARSQRAGGSDAGAAGEDPESVVGAVLALVDVDEQLRLVLL